MNNINISTRLRRYTAKKIEVEGESRMGNRNRIGKGASHLFLILDGQPLYSAVTV